MAALVTDSIFCRINNGGRVAKTSVRVSLRRVVYTIGSPGDFKKSFARLLISETTYTRTGGFCESIIPRFSPGGTQNPPVLPGTESVCSGRQHPLSAPGGRQRYNTLDFTHKVVCHETAGFIGFFLPRQRCRLWKPLPTGHSRPYWKPRVSGDTSPLNAPMFPVRCATN